MSIEAVLFDFSDVVGRMRMATSGDPGSTGVHIELITEVANAIDKLRKAGFKTALVTNNDRDSFKFHAPHLNMEEMFDVVVFSSDVGVSKPNFGIFAFTLKQLGVDAHEAMFFDDAPRNVDAAVAMGMTGLIVERPSIVVDAINDLLTQNEQ